VVASKGTILKESYFLWPKAKLIKFFNSLNLLTSASHIENVLFKMFPSGYPVLCSSGRAALNIALVESKVSRSDLVGVFPYASHCVLDSISRVATPLAGTESKKSSLRIVYHQWSFVQEKNLNSNSIEDCVDTLCVPGTLLFPGGGSFEVWSLPKILGTTSGGILWCKTKELAESARHTRNIRGGGLFLSIIRLCSIIYPNAYHYWEGVEASRGQTSKLQHGEILKAINNWNFIVNDRIRKLNVIWPYAIDFLEQPRDRLPPVVPVFFKNINQKIESIGILSGSRIIERKENNNFHLQRVIPIPIHQDVSMEWLELVIKKLGVKKCT
jgi:putative PLP-dependent aminotransferase (TIGR04422 family)